MRQDSEDMMLKIIAEHPGGITSKQITAILGIKYITVGKWLAELFFAGKVERQRNSKRQNCEYVYRLPPPKIEAPQSQWQPEPRFAQPYDAEAV
jgi:hypothetical protein